MIAEAMNSVIVADPFTAVVEIAAVYGVYKAYQTKN